MNTNNSRSFAKVLQSIRYTGKELISPEEEILVRDFVMSCLFPKQKKVLILYLQGMSTQRIAEQLRMKDWQVQNIMTRTRKDLTKIIKAIRQIQTVALNEEWHKRMQKIKDPKELGSMYHLDDYTEETNNTETENQKVN